MRLPALVPLAGVGKRVAKPKQSAIRQAGEVLKLPVVAELGEPGCSLGVFALLE